ncbi:putative methyltransferase-like protein 24 [Babylonia areolata]|uniref:putative methyltransferase-like protein 24 n=1 Tax=Babylonia areolata TaxID=304850 RepID=UPI003FD3E322
MSSRKSVLFITGCVIVVAGVCLVSTHDKVLTAISSIHQILKTPTAERRLLEEEDLSANDHPDMRYLRKHEHTDSLPPSDEMDRMSEKDMSYAYHSYLDNINFLCHRKLRMGRVADGGWDMCDDYEYRPVQPCIVYSFGIHNDFSFDDDVAKLYGCHVHSFDPSMEKPSHDRSPLVHFHNVGLGGEGGRIHVTTNWTMKSFFDLRNMLNHQQEVIDIVKMDIEFSEWSALPNMVETGELNHTRQLLVEFHKPASGERLRKQLYTLKKLDSLGFKRFHTHPNRFCGRTKQPYPVTRVNCYEVYFVNTRFIRRRFQ